MEEGEGRSGESMDFDVAADSLDSSDVFHIVIDVVGFILFIHQQIPSVFQEISQEFGELQAELKELEGELAKTEVNGISISTRKKLTARKREVKMGIRSPLRPLHVYELSFPQGRPVSRDCTRSKQAENLSRKVIRTMISRGVGSDSCAGPTKLFILVKATSELNLPLHFLPKREFRQNKKIVPFRLKFTCIAGERDTNSDSANHLVLHNSISTEYIWFQCRHTIKGLSFTRLPADD